MKKNLTLIIVVSLIILAARLIPHAPNFSPLASVVLFTGVYGQNKQYFIWPFLALFVSDLSLGFYEPFIMLSVYGSFALILLIGHLMKNHKNIINLISASLGSALLFFLITNFMVWQASTWYPANGDGLILCYTLAIPFFKNTVLSNLLYSGLLFGIYELLQLKLKHRAWLINK